MEADGSRWIATVDLTPEWKDYTLLPDRFKAWPVPGPSEKRGRFHPERAVTCCVGLAMSHTALEGDQHEYWFDDLGTARADLGVQGALALASVIALVGVHRRAGVGLAELPMLPYYHTGGGASGLSEGGAGGMGGAS